MITKVKLGRTAWDEWFTIAEKGGVNLGILCCEFSEWFDIPDKVSEVFVNFSDLPVEGDEVIRYWKQNEDTILVELLDYSLEHVILHISSDFPWIGWVWIEYE